jgi:hypothetical protein
MKQVLAELHSLINDLEDQGLTVEASSLQEVFVRVAQEADEDMDDHEGDLPKMVADVLAKHSVPEVIAEIANQMEDDKEDTQTMSFSVGDESGGYGNEPKDQIINEFVTQVKRKENTPVDAYKMMNDRLRFNGHDTMGYNDFLNLTEPKTSSFAFGDEPGVQEPKTYREPKHVIVNEFVDQAIKKNMNQDDAYFMMNQRLNTNGHNTLSKKDFDEMVENKSIMNPNGTIRQDVLPFPKQTKKHRQGVLEESERQIKEMNEFYAKHQPYPTAPGPQTSR